MEKTAVRGCCAQADAPSESVAWMKGSVRYHWDSEHRWLGVRWASFSRFASLDDVVSPWSRIDREKGWVYLEDLTDGHDFLRRVLSDAMAHPFVIRHIPEVCDGPVSSIRAMPSVACLSGVSFEQGKS